MYLGEVFIKSDSQNVHNLSIPNSVHRALDRIVELNSTSKPLGTFQDTFQSYEQDLQHNELDVDTIISISFLSPPPVLRARVMIASFIHHRHERQATLFRRHTLKVQACVLGTWLHRNTQVRRNSFTDHFLLVAVPESMLLSITTTSLDTTNHDPGDEDA